jgi:hypothetical protein
MHAQFHLYPTARRRVARLRTTAALYVALTISLVAFLVALPTAPASASSSTPKITLPATVSALPSSEVENLLSGIPLGDLTTAQLTEVLSKLPSLSGLPADKLKEALTNVIEGLDKKDAPLGQLLDPTEIVPTLETELKKLLSLPELLSLLKGENLTTKLTEALGSLDPSQLLGTLLSSSGTPEQLLTKLFATLNPEKLLDTTLTGEPFSKATVGELAGDLGMTTATFAKELNTTTTQLPETATALTTPLTNGKILGVLNGLGGVTLSLLGSSENKGKEASKETTKENSKETAKENGGSQSKETTRETSNGSSGPGNPTPAGPQGTAVIVSVPLAQTGSTQSPAAKSARSTKKTGKIKVLSHRVRGKVVTVVVQVPAAGKLALDGTGVALVRRETAKAERVTLRTVLTKAGVTSLRRHHRLRVKLAVSFKITGGPSSSSLLTVTFA